MLKHITAFAISAILLAFWAQEGHAQARTTTPMIEKPSVVEYGFRPYGNIMIAAMVRDVGGKTAVCGFWAVSSRLQAYVIATKLDRRARQTTTILLGKTRLLKGVDFMNKVSMDDFAVGTQARCQVTTIPWQAGFSGQKLEFSTPRLTTRS
ncbi:MAG: hypothetical protein AAFY25_05340 [Pseudomonadota bacterium]